MKSTRNKKNPLVTVVIPTYSSLRTIEKCLESIKEQTYPLIDLVVVDSLYYNKEDKKKSKQIIKKYARFFEDGPERSIQRNRGIEEAKGKYIFMVDQDMYLSPGVIEECVAYMETGKYAALYVPEISIGKGYWTACVTLDRYVNNYLENGLNDCCRFFKKLDAKRIGGYDPTMIGAEDSDFNNKIAKLGKIGRTTKVIYHDEGEVNFFTRVKKKYYYSKGFKKYFKRYPEIASKQFSPFKFTYIKHWRQLVKKPHVAAGMFLLKGSETIAGILGLIFK